MTSTRPCAVAGSFYPAQKAELQKVVLDLLQGNSPGGDGGRIFIVPHAGYIYSGPIAASAYKLLKKSSAKITRVVLLGPSHRVPLRGLALSTAERFETPLGSMPIDQVNRQKVLAFAQVLEDDSAHREEHSLEVHLPFLQTVLGEFSLLPLVVGLASAAEVADVLAAVWGGEETAIIISSDLSHFHPYQAAKKIDQATSHAIEQLQTDLEGEQACGCYAINGLLKQAKIRGLKISTLDLRNSGDTAGSHDRVVGYGSYVLRG